MTTTPALGPPVVGFFGVAAADDLLEDPTIDGEIPIYQRTFGFGFCDGNGSVNIDELVATVSGALVGCA